MLMLIIIMIFKWLKFKETKMESECNSIKTTMKLIMSTNLSTNLELKQEILNNQRRFKILI